MKASERFTEQLLLYSSQDSFIVIKPVLNFLSISIEILQNMMVASLKPSYFLTHLKVLQKEIVRNWQ